MNHNILHIERVILEYIEHGNINNIRMLQDDFTCFKIPYSIYQYFRMILHVHILSSLHDTEMRNIA